jgi:hypothetical protein
MVSGPSTDPIAVIPRTSRSTAAGEIPASKPPNSGKPLQSEKDARANPHRPEYYVPRGALTLASFIERMGKKTKRAGPRLQPAVAILPNH